MMTNRPEEYYVKPDFSNAASAVIRTARHFEMLSGEWWSKGQNPKDYWFRRTVFATNLLADYLPPNARCLDIGCASGHLCRLLHELGCDVYGLDIASAMISAVRTRMGAFGVPEDHFNIYDGLSFPFQAGTLELVSALDVLQYIENQPQYIAEIYRILKPGGFALVTNTNRGSLFVMGELIKRAFTRIPGRTFWRENINLVLTGYWSGGFVHYSRAIQARSADALDDFFESAGFQVVDGFDMYNVQILDRDPLHREGFSAFAARYWAWNHFGLYRKI